ncbi:MAG: heme-binding protein [Acidobacteriota bacterium]
MKLLKTGAASALLLSLAAMGQAQTMDKKSLNAVGARRVIDAAVHYAKQANTTGVIAVVDDGGNLMAVERIDGTFSAGANISIGKARTAALFKKPTKFFEDVVGKGRTSMVALNDFTPLQGGVPITIDGQIVGAVGVSGASSAAQDEELALAGAAALQAGNSPVVHFDGAKVEEAFKKGAVLFDSSDKYMVHASRREKPGMAEIHTLDADIVHVLDGTATLVTGGKATDVKSVAADEFRGASIEGGDTRELKKGDVIIIPAGVPHWFKDVTNPFLYYVVKAR